jgi:hypothetical protein
MGAVLQFINPAVSAYIDLTNPDNNPGAMPTSTPRQGGFTLQNRVNFTNVTAANKRVLNASGAVTSASTASSQVGARILILEVPERTFVKNLKVFSVPGATAPNHAFVLAASSTASASDWSVAELQFGARQYTRTQRHASFSEASHAVWHTGYTASTGEVFGGLTMTVATASLPKGSIAALPSAISATSTTPWAGSTELMPNDPNGDNDASAVPQGQYFPYGGHVTMQLGPLGTNITMASSALTNGALYTDTFTGTWHFVADANYVPE